MTKAVSYFVLFGFVIVAFVLIGARPDWVSDHNHFLRDFVNHELLNLLAVILAITLASMANIHLEFNKIEERHQREGLSKSRENLRKNAAWLVGLFCAGVITCIVKPIIDGGQTGEAIANMVALFIVLWQILILISLNRLVFSIPPDIRPPNQSEPPAPQSPPGTGSKRRRKTHLG